MELLKLRYEVRSFLGQYPQVFIPLARLKSSKRSLVVNEYTDLVIEGYPRSANTFATAAFSTSQRDVVQIAHHLHLPAQVIWAVKRGIPVLLLVRNPGDAVLSRVIRNPVLSIRQSLRDYIRYHRSVLPYHDGYIVATFDQVIHDFGAVIKKVNERFGCNFCPFEHTPENVERVLGIVEQRHLRRTRSDKVDETMVSRPSLEKEESKARLREQLSYHTDLLTTAETLYTDFLSLSVSQVPLCSGDANPLLNHDAGIEHFGGPGLNESDSPNV
jgi:hypothetical protein